MNITVKDNGSRYHVAKFIESAVSESRFTCEIIFVDNSTSRLKIKNIRLRESKLYCGNHPNACENNFGAPPRKGRWLEGADWVEFNDLINDVLDSMHVSAYIYTAVCIVRKGTKRRTRYGSYRYFNNWFWNKDESDDKYVDYCGSVAPPSEYPFGTPGEYKRVVSV